MNIYEYNLSRCLFFLHRKEKQRGDEEQAWIKRAKGKDVVKRKDEDEEKMSEKSKEGYVGEI